MKVDMVFEGGGVHGISFIGALTLLKQQGYEIERCAGTSAGAIVAALVTAGYNTDELYEIMRNTNYAAFKKNKSYGRLPLGREVQLLLKKGLYNGENIEAWIRPILKKKGISKFKDVMENGKSRLKIIASDITNRDMIILPDDLVKYDLDPAEFDIAVAVRMSASIPLYFTPCYLNHKFGVSYIVDGGLLSNFPIWIFDVEGVPRWPTFGLKIKDQSSKTSMGKHNFRAYISDVIASPLYINEEHFVRDKDLVRTIVIDSGDIKSTDFYLKPQTIKELYTYGYNCTKRFLTGWNFERYISCNRM